MSTEAAPPTGGWSSAGVEKRTARASLEAQRAEPALLTIGERQ
jgi:hypothetical protein